MIYNVTIDETTYRVELERLPSGWRSKLNGREFPVDVAPLGAGSLSLLVCGSSYEVLQESSPQGTNVIVGGNRFNVIVTDPRSLRARGAPHGGLQGPKKIIAPMPGKVVRILAEAGSQVEYGQPVLVIEAMKMQNELKAPKKGKLSKIHVMEGVAVEAGQSLAEIE